jgi:glycosyltransferase involved in cell wall biosynthesis
VVTVPKIAILTDYPADHTTFVGGVETATAALLEGLKSYQHELDMHIVSMSTSIAADISEERDGFQFHFLSIPRQKWLRPRLPFRVARVYDVLRRLSPDLVHCQANMAMALAAAFDRSTRVFTVHGVDRNQARFQTGMQFWSSHLDAVIEQYVHHRFDAIVCISAYAASVVDDRTSTFAIPNAISSRFFQTPVRRACRDRPYVLFIGVLVPRKRPADLLAAHAELRRSYPNLETLFCGSVGDAGYVRSMERTIAERGIEGVRFLGRVSQEALVELLSGATALVLPSAEENAPMAIAEAMAIGVPVVATPVGGVGDMVRHGETGFLYPVGDVDALTARLGQLLDDPSLRDRLGSQSRSVARRTHAPDQVARATVDVYRRLLRV